MSSTVDRAMLEVITALLRQGRTIDRFSQLITVAALILLIASIMMGAPKPVLALAILAGVAEVYFAVRVGFDAALFERLCDPAAMDLVALDAGLTRLGLAPASRSDRPLGERIAGARRLFYKQGAALLIQIGALVFGAAAALVF
jgi:hypothetical protein